jgi:hypothetical protein
MEKMGEATERSRGYMNSWMKRLALHYEHIRDRYPDDRMIILFDIDDTILDMRYTVLYVLQSFDEHHNTHFFKGLKALNVTTHEADVEILLDELSIPLEWRAGIVNWYREKFWSREAIHEAHKPFVGVMEVIRWFQIQPNTYVGLNTGRPESIRMNTLHSLNKIGQEYKIHFSNALLYMMKPGAVNEDVVASKVEGMRHFQKAGYRIFAYVDNEPENLEAAAELDPDKQILLLHANTIFKSKRKKLPPRAVIGKKYDVVELIHEKVLPRHVQFVWHGVNDGGNLRQFLASNIRWAECDVRLDPHRKSIILRDDSFDTVPLQQFEKFLTLNEILIPFKNAGKSIKLDLKEGGLIIETVIELLMDHSMEGGNVWFNGQIEVLKEAGFRTLAGRYPEAIIQCSIDALIPLILSVPLEALALLDKFRDWGINRFSISWKNMHCTEILNKLDKWGFEANIYHIPDLASFLRAVLLLPSSITSDFNFPKWQYYGRGSGSHKKWHVYSTAGTVHSLSA